MASLFWSWIFIIQLIRPSFAQSNSYEVLAQRAVEKVFARNLSKAEKSRNTFIALAIAGSVVLVAFFVVLLVFFFRQRRKVSEPESGRVEKSDKPHWFMVDGKGESRMDKWRLSLKLQATPKDGTQLPPEGSRIERLKAALNRKAAKAGKPLLPLHNQRPPPSPRDTLGLPLQSVPQYPDVLERGYRAPIYPAQQSPPQIPALTRTMYEDDKPQPRSPPKAIVTQGLSRTHTRNDRRNFPRSPAANRRKSWLTRGNQLRNPFLPLNDLDAPIPAVPQTASVDGSKPLTHAYSLSKPRAAPNPPKSASSLAPPVPSKGPRRVPTALNLDEGAERKVRVGLPTSPRVLGLPTSPRPRARPQSPAI